jgi:molybdate transport system substrate-binding protein
MLAFAIQSHRRFLNVFSVLGALLLATAATMAQVKVMISGGFSGPYEQLLPEFEKTTGIKVMTGSGASQGSGPQTIGAQLARGVTADVVILSREGLTELMKAGRIAQGTDVDLARTPIGVAVRAGASKPDVRSVEDFKRVVTKAKVVAVPSSTSGIFLRDEVFPRLGIAGQVNTRFTPRGASAAALVASGEADIALLPVSEIIHSPGVEVAGVIADEIQLHQIFAAAAVAGSAEMNSAKALIGFLASERAAATIRAGGMEPLGKR